MGISFYTYYYSIKVIHMPPPTTTLVGGYFHLSTYWPKPNWFNLFLSLVLARR